MKRFVLFFFLLYSSIILRAQSFDMLKASFDSMSLDSLKIVKSELDSLRSIEQKKADRFKKIEINYLDNLIKIYTDSLIKTKTVWEKNLLSTIGLDLNNSNNWASTNAYTTNLNIGIQGSANMKKNKFYWENKGRLTKAWEDIDLSDVDEEEDVLFDNSTLDILKLESKVEFGKKMYDKFSFSVLAALNTSIGNFLDPGTLDFSVGITLKLLQELKVDIHLLNYHLGFTEIIGVKPNSALGAKIRAEYNKTIDIKEKPIEWSSSFNTFFPYRSVADGEETLFEYTWLNTFTYEIEGGFGITLDFGLRMAKFEIDALQSYYLLGFSYSL